MLNLEDSTMRVVNAVPDVLGIWEPSLEESILAAYNYRQEITELILLISTTENNANIAISKTKPTVSIFNSFDTYISEGELGVVLLEKVIL